MANTATGATATASLGPINPNEASLRSSVLADPVTDATLKEILGLRAEMIAAIDEERSPCSARVTLDDALPHIEYRTPHDMSIRRVVMGDGMVRLPRAGEVITLEFHENCLALAHLADWTPESCTA
jgi:hypothetical protein